VQKATLLQFGDRLRVALAGNLADYTFIDRRGQRLTGADVDYNGAPTGYTRDPREHIAYVSAHDNETLFDALQCLTLKRGGSRFRLALRPSLSLARVA
jgi:pullulanase